MFQVELPALQLIVHDPNSVSMFLPAELGTRMHSPQELLLCRAYRIRYQNGVHLLGSMRRRYSAGAVLQNHNSVGIQPRHPSCAPLMGHAQLSSVSSVPHPPLQRVPVRMCHIDERRPPSAEEPSPIRSSLRLAIAPVLREGPALSRRSTHSSIDSGT